MILSDYMQGTCQTCAHCSEPASGNFNDATCDAVVDPFTGQPFNVKVARLDTHPQMGWKLPCGYAGMLWAPNAALRAWDLSK